MADGICAIVKPQYVYMIYKGKFDLANNLMYVDISYVELMSTHWFHIRKYDAFITAYIVDTSTGYIRLSS